MTSVDRIQGLSGSLAVKAPVRAATTAAITLSGEQTVDGVAVVEGDRVLVKNQASSVDNGIYDVSSGGWTRALDFNGSNDVVDGTLVVVTNGTSANLFSVSGTNPITPGTSAISILADRSFGQDGLPTVEVFDGGGSTFVLSQAAEVLANIELYISGVCQRPTTDFTYDNGTLTVSTTSATPAGTGNVLIRYNRPRAAETPEDGSITTAKLVDDAVTYAKMQNVSATDKLLGRSTAGAGNVEEIACTAAGRAILDDADATAQRTTLGLGSLATQSGTFSGTSSGTNTGDQTITLTGAVTGSGTGSFATTLTNDAVTYAKMQNVSATDKLLGRSTAGAGDVEEITCTAFARSILDDANEATFKATVNLEIGVDVQAYDANTAKINATQTFTAPQRGTLTTDNDGSFDLNATNNFKCTPSGALALTFTNVPAATASQSGNILLINTGGHAITAAAGTKIPSATLTAISAAGTYLLGYFSDGTNVYVAASGAMV